jgi:NADH dehydrogenase FAD-containing subunit
VVSSCPAESRLASNGALKVNEFLQVEGYSNIYAIGDCADTKEPKMAYHAGLHANVAVANIVNSMKQRPLKAYKPGEESLFMFVGLGLDMRKALGPYSPSRCLNMHQSTSLTTQL